MLVIDTSGPKEKRLDMTMVPVRHRDNPIAGVTAT
jgi:hypothetical protein